MSPETDTARQKLTVGWAEGESAEVTSVDELDQRLDALDEQARDSEPFAVTLERPDGATLSIVLGRDWSIVNHMASLDPPYYTSYDPHADADGTVVFYYYGHWSELPTDCTIPVQDAREAARRFFSDGQRPENIDWRED